MSLAHGRVDMWPVQVVEIRNSLQGFEGTSGFALEVAGILPVAVEHEYS